MQIVGSKTNWVFLKRGAAGISYGLGGMSSSSSPPPSFALLSMNLISRNHSKASSKEFSRGKHGREHDKIETLEDALKMFDEMLRIRPLPSVVCFNQLLGQIAKMKHYSVVISRYKQMGLRGIPTNVYTLNIMIDCFCHLNSMGFSSSMLGKLNKSGYEPDTATLKKQKLGKL